MQLNLSQLNLYYNIRITDKTFIWNRENNHLENFFSKATCHWAWINAAAAEKLEFLEQYKKLPKMSERKAADMLNVKRGFLRLVVQKGTKIRSYSDKTNIRQSWCGYLVLYCNFVYRTAISYHLRKQVEVIACSAAHCAMAISFAITNTRNQGQITSEKNF